MIIKPMIRSNVHIAAHPTGIEKSVAEMIDWVKTQGNFKTDAKNVLIVGGSSGYGFGSRCALAFGAGANTINVSFEAAPQGKRTGSAGWWNNVFFQQAAEAAGLEYKDFVGDAFSNDTKELVANYIKETCGKIDLLVYSLASGVRTNQNTGELVRSSLKPLGKSIEGKTIDIAKGSIIDLTVEAGTQQEIDDTVYVMGGDDWQLWVNFLAEKGLLSEKCKTIAYTYIGAESMSDIYRAGTIGKAKEDLEKTANELNNMLSTKFGGEALISVSKAVATKASVFIPGMPIYGCILFDEMIKKGTHETVVEHKYRLFKDMVYGSKRLVDEKGRIRLDSFEMQNDIQENTLKRMRILENDQIELLKLEGAKEFIGDFYKMNGFEIENVDYNADVDMEYYSNLDLK